MVVGNYAWYLCSIHPFPKVKSVVLACCSFLYVGSQTREETGPKVALNHNDRFCQLEALFLTSKRSFTAITYLLYVYEVEQTQDLKLHSG